MESKNSYYVLVKAKIEGELAKSEFQHSEVEAEYSDRHIFISTLMSMPKNPTSGAEEEQIKKSISKIRGKLQASKGVLRTIVESGQQVQERKKEEDRIVNLKYKSKRKEIALIDTKGEIFEAMEELRRLQSDMQDLQEKSDLLREKVEKMAKRLQIPFTLRTSHHVEEYQSGQSSFQLKVKPCALSDSTFPQMEIIVAPCQCTYHPWCVVMQSRLADECGERECKEKFTETWKKSLGLDIMPEYYFEKQPSESQLTKRKRKHTNSDIRGINFSKRKRK